MSNSIREINGKFDHEKLQASKRAEDLFETYRSDMPATRVRDFQSIESAVVAVWVAEQLAAGALSWLGGRIMESLFGDGGDSSIDLERLMEDTIRSVENVIKKAIGEHELNRARVSLDALSTEWSYYLKSPSNDRLSYCTMKAGELCSAFKACGVHGHHLWLVAVGLQIHIVQERIRKVNQSERYVLNSIIDRAQEQRQIFNNEWRDWSFSQFSIETVSRTPQIWIVRGPDGEVVDRAAGNIHDFHRLEQRYDNIRGEWHSKNTWPVYIEPAEKVCEQWGEVRHSRTPD